MSYRRLDHIWLRGVSQDLVQWPYWTKSTPESVAERKGRRMHHEGGDENGEGLTAGLLGMYKQRKELSRTCLIADNEHSRDNRQGSKASFMTYG